VVVPSRWSAVSMAALSKVDPSVVRAKNVAFPGF